MFLFIYRVTVRVKTSFLYCFIWKEIHAVAERFSLNRDSNAFDLAVQDKKLDILIKNNWVCLEFDIDYESITSDNVCVQF